VGPEMTETDFKLAIKVIKAAKKLGVKRLKLDTLEFELSDVAPVPPRPRTALKVSKEQIIKQQTDDSEQLKLSGALDDLATMNVDDPAAFEAAIVENELFDGDHIGDELEETQNI
jgi:hypothetical protein